MESKAPKTLEVLKRCVRPSRYTELLRKINISDRGLRMALKTLIQKGWVKKLPSGEYVLTEEGKMVLENIKLQESLKILGEEDEFIKEIRVKIRRRASLIALYEALYLLYLLLDTLKIGVDVVNRIDKEYIPLLEEILRKNGIENIDNLRNKCGKIIKDYIELCKERHEFFSIPSLYLDKFFLQDISVEIEARLNLVDVELFSIETGKICEEIILLIKKNIPYSRK